MATTDTNGGIHFDAAFHAELVRWEAAFTSMQQELADAKLKLADKEQEQTVTKQKLADKEQELVAKEQGQTVSPTVANCRKLRENPI